MAACTTSRTESARVSNPQLTRTDASTACKVDLDEPLLSGQIAKRWRKPRHPDIS